MRVSGNEMPSVDNEMVENWLVVSRTAGLEQYLTSCKPFFFCC